MLATATANEDTSTIPLVAELMTLELSVADAEEVLSSVCDYTPGPFLLYRYTFYSFSNFSARSLSLSFALSLSLPPPLPFVIHVCV